ncbi:MAG TPA: hypothetical protein VMN35_06530 [Gaiellaceae bacterium]|nr:hypothetical protein [Gaiellaceae bacterium]
MVDLAREALVAGVVEPDLVAPKPAEPAEHLREDSGRESSVLLGGEPAEQLEPIAGLDGQEVDDVSGLGAAEEREELVGGEVEFGAIGALAAEDGRDSGVDPA